MVCNLHSSKPNPADDFKKFNQFIANRNHYSIHLLLNHQIGWIDFCMGLTFFKHFFFTNHFWRTQTWTVWEHLIHISNETPDSFHFEFLNMYIIGIWHINQDFLIFLRWLIIYDYTRKTIYIILFQIYFICVFRSYVQNIGY